VTHVLLPVPLLLRRAYLAELIWAALVAKPESTDKPMPIRVSK
jgi:hypothetical protein